MRDDVINDLQSQTGYGASRRLGVSRLKLLETHTRFPRWDGFGRVSGRSLTAIAEGRETVMNIWDIFPLIVGYERVGDQVRLYVDGPTPEPSFTRQRGVRTPLFHLYAGRDAEAVLAWLDRNRVWQCLRVPPLTPQCRASVPSCWPPTGTAALAPRCSASPARG